MLFSYSEMAVLRAARFHGWTMDQMCRQALPHSRDEVVEALDALVREPDTRLALERVNKVLTLQAANVPLINGREHWQVTADRGRKSYGLGG